MFIGTDLVPDPEQIMRLQAVARGDESADLAIRGGTVLALHNRELIERDVLIVGQYIAAVTPPGRLEAVEEIDASGRYVSPTFIDVHLHIEYTMLTRVSWPGVSCPAARQRCWPTPTAWRTWSAPGAQMPWPRRPRRCASSSRSPTRFRGCQISSWEER